MVTYNSLICIHMENFKYKIHCLLSQSQVSLNRGQPVFGVTMKFMTGSSLPKPKNDPLLLASVMPSRHPITLSHWVGVQVFQQRGRQPGHSDPFPLFSVMSWHQFNLRPVPWLAQSFSTRLCLQDLEPAYLHLSSVRMMGSEISLSPSLVTSSLVGQGMAPISVPPSAGLQGLGCI